MDYYFFEAVWVSSLLIFLLSLFHRKLGCFLVTPLIIFSFLLAGFRDETFPDVVEYYKIFGDVSILRPFSSEFNQVHSEVGFKLIAWSLAQITSNLSLVMLAYAMMACGLLFYITRRYSLSLPAVWLVYYSTAFVLKDFGQIRNSMASLLVVDGVLLLGRKAALLRFCLASVVFQYLAIVTYAARYIKWGAEFFVLLGAAAVASQLINFELLFGVFGASGYLAQYEGTMYVDASAYSALPALARVILFTVVAVVLGRGLEGDRRYINLRKALIGSLLFYLTFLSIPILSQRLGGYLIAVDAFMCAVLLERRQHILAALWVVLYSASTFYFNVLSREFLREGYKAISFG